MDEGGHPRFVAHGWLVGMVLPYAYVIAVVVHLALTGVRWQAWFAVAVMVWLGVAYPWRVSLDERGVRVWYAFRRPVSAPREELALHIQWRLVQILRRRHNLAIIVPGGLVRGTKRVRQAASALGYPVLSQQAMRRWIRGEA